MNKKVFDGLPKNVQDGVVKASKIAEQRFAGVYDAAFEKVKAEQLAAGYTVTTMSSADVDVWASSNNLAKHQADWVEGATKAGLANASEIMVKMRALHKEAMSR
jgi:TRAP-type C4-dicarboxylate transport system substrate-binding protein